MTEWFPGKWKQLLVFSDKLNIIEAQYTQNHPPNLLGGNKS